MPFDLQQPSLTGGEISPSLYGRVDLARYATSLRLCRNFIVRPFGGVDNRPGTAFIAEVKDSTKVTGLIPFRFSQDQNYALEFGEGYIRFYRNGTQIEDGGSPVEVATPYLEAELPELRFTQSADVMTIVHPNHAQRELRRSSEISWALALYVAENGPFLPINVDTSNRVFADEERGEVTLTALEDVFTADHVGGLFYMEPSSFTKVSPWEGNKQIAAATENPYGQVRTNDGKYYICRTNQTATAGNEIRTGNVPPIHEKGIAADGDGNAITSGTTTFAERAGVEWEYLHSGFGIVKITGFTSAKIVTGLVVSRLPSDCVSVGGVTLTSLVSPLVGTGVTKTYGLPDGGGPTSDISSEYIVEEVVLNPGFIYDPKDYSIDATGNTITFDTAPVLGANINVDQYATADGVTDFWAFGAWSDEYGYPSAVTYFSDRLSFAGNTERPQTTWMSRTASYDDFGKTVPLIDSDAIEFTMNSREINPIVELIPLSNMIILTTGSVWKMTVGADSIVAPDTIGVDPEYYLGAKNVRPEVIGNTALYVQSQGESIRDLKYTFEADGYEGDDLTLMAGHLFTGFDIEDIAFHQTPYTSLWTIRDDGKLLNMTYLKRENVIGWSQHDTDGGDKFERVCVIPEGNEDYLYTIVNRTIEGATKRYVERLSSRKYTTIDHAWFVDSGLKYDGTNTNPANTMALTNGVTWEADEEIRCNASFSVFTASSVGDIIELFANDGTSVRVRIITFIGASVVECIAMIDIPVNFRGGTNNDWVYQADTISGLDHLEGRTVAVLNDGNEEDRKVVSSGSIALDRPGGVVIVGLPIQADIETLEVNFAGSESVAAKKKIIPSVSLLVRDSRGIQAGPSADKLREFKQRNDEPLLDSVTPLTGVATIPVDSSWKDTGRVFIRQDSPLPLSVLSIIPKVEVGE